MISKVTSEIYRQRQKLLIEQTNGEPVVVAGYVSMQFTGDMAAKFQQEASFLWLTGIEVPGWKLLLLSDDERYLIAPEIEGHHEVFDGSLSHDAAKGSSGVTAVLDHIEGAEKLAELMNTQKIVWSIGSHPHEKYFGFIMNPAPNDLWNVLSEKVSEVRDIRPLLAKLRAIKSPEEIHEIRSAIDLTINAFANIRKQMAQFAHEYEVEAEFTYTFNKAGVDHAYAPIVAAGEHACTLHYVENDAPLSKNGLILLDIGARVNHYAADITRTYALGVPSDREQAVHAEVEKAHHEIIALLKPGYSVETYHDQVDVIMKRALESLGLLKKKSDYRTYFPHAISHGLGVDVHDSLGAPKEFAPGMVLTVEPGIYIPEEGIGVRIEDDILITEDGFENLSRALPTSL